MARSLSGWVLAVLSALLLIANSVQAAQPSSGMLALPGDRLAWTGGPLTAVNPAIQTCVQGVSCDTLSFDLVIPAGKVAQVRVRIDWSGASNDFDLFVLDAQGSTRGSSTAGSTVFE